MELSTVYKKPKKKAAAKKVAKEQAEACPLLLCQKDKLAIVASAEPTRGMAPFDDEDFELWGLSVTATYDDVGRLDMGVAVGVNIALGTINRHRHFQHLDKLGGLQETGLARLDLRVARLA